MIWFIFIIIFALVGIALFLMLFGYKWLRVLSNKLPPIEHFLPFPRKPVRIGALIFGIICWSSLIFYFTSNDKWRTFRGAFSIELTTPSGEVVRSNVSRASSKEVVKRLRELNFDVDIKRIQRHSADYSILAREIGLVRLESIIDEVPDDLILDLYIQHNSNLIPAFFLRETIEMDAQPLWRGWFTKQIAPEPKPAILNVSLWCGFDLSGSRPERFCNMVLPMPLFQRLHLKNVNELYKKGVTMSAPFLFLRLDTKGAQIIGSQITQHNFKKRKKSHKVATPEELGLAFSLQGENEHILWGQLVTETLKLALDMVDQTNFERQRILWSKRQIQSKDRWLFADEGSANFTRQIRKIATPQLVDLAHDFLKPGEPPRIDGALRDWIVANLSAKAILEIEDEDAKICSDIAMRFWPIDGKVDAGRNLIQKNGSSNRQAILVNKGFCPTDILPLLFVETWARF